MTQRAKKTIQFLSLALIPIFIVLSVWFSALAFTPVPWPDDSAFYFVAKELFKWPPRWVMLPQAPFEPTYRIFNFNTMPLYPILIGLGRFVGIDGTFLLKFWPLTAWALSGSLLVTTLYRKGLPYFFCLLLALAFTLDPEERWASVLLRPESLIGLFGMALVLGITLGFPTRLRPTKLWDPVAALLALAAYAHFNAIHLIFPVIFVFAAQPKRLLQIASKTTLYLAPWLFFVAIHWDLFWTQMDTQWTRLNVPNPWLSSISSALRSLFQDLGCPAPWPSVILYASAGMWILILAALGWGVFTIFKIKNAPKGINLLPAAGWLLGSLLIWHSKPEVWFVYYIHVALWCFCGLAVLKIHQEYRSKHKTWALAVSTGWITAITTLFGYVHISQAIDFRNTQTWNWPTYDSFVSCIDEQLTLLESQTPPDRPFRVWGPTFPDVTIELSRRHPQWELTRTNDFMSRATLAVQHGWDTQAVVVTETLSWNERNISEKPEKAPGIQSLWMGWKGYFLNSLYESNGWKPNRFICQRGRWQAFLFMIDPLQKESTHPIR